VTPDVADVSVSASSRGSDKPGGTGSPGGTEGAGGPGGISPGSEPGRSGKTASRAALTVARSIGRDFRTVFSRPIRLLRERKLMAIPGTVVCVAIIALFALLQHFPGGLTLMLDVAGVHQAEPLWEVLLQLPLSMFAPAPMLPAWGAMLQVALAFGISECWLGWRRMIMIAVVTSAVTSMAARVMVFIQSTFSIGTPEIDNWQLDTGPSVAVVALLVYLALRLRTYWIVAVTAVSMGGEAAILPNLAGREHLVAISLGFLTYFVLDVWGPAWKRRRAGTASGGD
jgi:hypothetical protein